MMPDLMIVFLALLISYLAGSFPSSLVISRLFFGKDIRKFGSGNAGATNAFRVLGKPAGFTVILLDMGKGVLSVLLISKIIPVDQLTVFLLSMEFFDPQWEQTLLWNIEKAGMLFCGVAAVIGHVWSVFAGFRGGKGVATSAAVFAFLYPAAAAGVVPVFFLTLTLSGMVSLSSLVSAAFFPVAVWLAGLLGIQELPVFMQGAAIIIALFIFYTHRTNIKRIIRGEESRFEKLMILKRFRGGGNGGHGNNG